MFAGEISLASLPSKQSNQPLAKVTPLPGVPTLTPGSLSRLARTTLRLPFQRLNPCRGMKVVMGKMFIMQWAVCRQNKIITSKIIENYSPERVCGWASGLPRELLTFVHRIISLLPHA